MDKKAVIPQEIRNYLESLIAEANVAVFDEKTKEDLISYLFDKLDKFLAAKIVENMSEADTQEFIKLNQEKKSKEEIDAYIDAHMQNPQEVFTRAFIDFRDFYLTGQDRPTQPAAQPSN